MPHLRQTIAAAVAAVIAAAATAFTVAPANAADSSDGYWKASWSATIYRQDGGAITALTYDQWKAAGFPAPQQASVHYERYSWSPTIYRYTYFGDFPHFGPHVESFDEWVAASQPAPETGDVNYLALDKWGTSSEVFATTPDHRVHKMVPSECVVYFRDGGCGEIVHPDQGFEKLTWAAPIATMTSLAKGTGSPITYAQWSAADFPTPRAVTRFPGDSFTRHRGSSTVYYSGPTLKRAITYAEWTAAGKPRPVVK